VPPDPSLRDARRTEKGQTTLQAVFASIANWLVPIAMLLEMVRRTVWGFFRLENEQLRNTEVGQARSALSLSQQCHVRLILACF